LEDKTEILFQILATQMKIW